MAVTPTVDRAALHAFITGSSKLGEYPAAQWAAWEERRRALLAECKARGITVHLTGSKAPGAQSHAPVTTLLGDVAAQLGERWPDPTRTDGMAWSLMEAIEQVWLCVIALDAADRTPTPAPAPIPPPAPAPAPSPPGTAWKSLPAVTAKLATSDRSSYQNTAPRFTTAGMRIVMPARGRDDTATNPTSDPIQRCEITIAGQEGITAGTRRFFRFDWTLGSGFPSGAGTWQVITQFKGDGTGSPPLSVEVRDGVFCLTWHKLPTSPVGDPMPIGRASDGDHSLILDVTFAETAKASPVSVWMNGTLLVEKAVQGATLYPGKADRVKCGLYRDAAVGKAADLTLRGFAAGSTLAAVTG